MYDVVTFGSACWDVFIKSKNISVAKNKEFVSGEGICFNLGSKVEVDEIYFNSGGGGTNTAATFVNQGLKAAYVGKVGCDLAGQEIVKELNERKIDAQFVFKTKKKPTNYSVVLKTQKGLDRTILVYRGASEFLTKNDINWAKLKRAKWFYLAPLSDNLAKETKNIVNFAVKNKIKIALNPSSEQLKLSQNALEEIISKIDILLLNQEEAAILTKIKYDEEKAIFKKLDNLCPGIAIMTKGPNGLVVSNGKTLFSAPGVRTRVIDNTGAGDALGSGFLAGFIKSKGEIEEGIKLGLANSISCIRSMGAKGGLLGKNDKLNKIKIKKKNL